MTIDRYRSDPYAVTTDNEGREVLAGLTFEETLWYSAYQADFLKDARRVDHAEAKLKFKMLCDQHERARIERQGITSANLIQL